MNESPFILKDIAQAFSKAAPQYDTQAIIQTEIGKRLLKRVELVMQEPATLLDVGSGTGLFTRELQQQFSSAQVIGIDIAFGMNAYAKKFQYLSEYFPLNNNKITRHPHYLCADAANVPLANESIDLIFSNLTLQWCFPLKTIFKEFYRIAKPSAEIFFTTLGPQTLNELRQSTYFLYEQNSTHPITSNNISLPTHPFCDLITIGNALQNAGFHEPVVDREMMTMTYQDIQKLFDNLQATGSQNKHRDRLKGCLSPRQFKTIKEKYEEYKNESGLYPATFEVIYGHAKKSSQPFYQEDENGIVRIPAKNIPRLARD